MNRNLDWWLGEREGGWAAHEAVFLGTEGICMLGKTHRYGDPLPEPDELGARAARAKSMTKRKAANRIEDLRELATLCLDLAQAFEQRLENESGIRRVQ